MFDYIISGLIPVLQVIAVLATFFAILNTLNHYGVIKVKPLGLLVAFLFSCVIVFVFMNLSYKIERIFEIPSIESSIPNLEQNILGSYSGYIEANEQVIDDYVLSGYYSLKIFQEGNTFFCQLFDIYFDREYLLEITNLSSTTGLIDIKDLGQAKLVMYQSGGVEITSSETNSKAFKFIKP